MEAVLPAEAVALLPPPTMAGVSFQGPNSPYLDELPSTHQEGYAEPPSTEAATLVGKSGGASWKGTSTKQAPAKPTRQATFAGSERTGNTSTAILLKAVMILIATMSCTLLIGVFIYALRGSRIEKKPTDPAIVAVPEPRKIKISTNFEDYWPKNYRPVEDYTQDMPWPEKVRRTDDLVVFNRLANGIYIPDTFVPDAEQGLASDGWPKVIVKDGMRFLRMPGGTWNMGNWDNPSAIDQPDGPLHPVKLTGYYIQEKEVTHGQLEDFMRGAGLAFPTDWQRVFNGLVRQVGRENAREYPASNLPRDMAFKFAKSKLGQLPTEAQWEYAARSLGQLKHYVWGDAPLPNRTLARIDSADATPAPVGSYPKAAGEPGKDKTVEGVFDMTGNVQEMCRDAWISSYRKSDDAVLDPCVVPDDPNESKYVIRGGSYASSGSDGATTRRYFMSAAELVENLGFRLVVECPDSRKSR